MSRLNTKKRARLPDRAFAFAVNRPDLVCLMNRPVEGLRSVVAWPVFVRDQAHEGAVIRWAKSADQRQLIEAFVLGPRESLQVYVNAVCAVVEAHRDIGIVVAQLAEVAEHIPAALAKIPVDCTNKLPTDLCHLAKYFSRWAHCRR